MSKTMICPICEKKPAVAEFRPFCSKRCADVDLSRWLSDAYTIPGEPADEADDTPSAEQRGELNPRDL